MVKQVNITLPAFERGFHLIDTFIINACGELPQTGIMHVFILHTSAGICINENADPTVLMDFETVFNKLVPEGMSYYKHDMEGDDDMPAHIKAVMAGSSVTIPITNGKLHLGTWQGIYLCEFRNRGGNRKLVVSIYS
ncbi:MAG: YjbQ family protein [Bacteroidetes bacterium]|jgi:secondary thiamine-phosphate synthase enzyme|nr:YjbQ family protein [Bacteroidota bacterium]